MDSRARQALSFAMQLADVARPIALGYFRTPLTITRKAGDSPVAAADPTIETEIRRRISERFSDHGVIGERTGAAKGQDYTWIVDPIVRCTVVEPRLLAVPHTALRNSPYVDQTEYGHVVTKDAKEDAEERAAGNEALVKEEGTQ